VADQTFYDYGIRNFHGLVSIANITFRMALRALKRKLFRELKSIEQEGRQDYAVTLSPANMLNWNILLFGAPGTDWEDAILWLAITFPAQYPFVVPDVRFTGVIPFHPNVYANGKICLDVLEQNWSPACNIAVIITSIQELLQNPNPDSCVNVTAAEYFVTKRGEYRRMVRKCVESTWFV
jgi:ubiquitin-conjugating enzyme E2 A